MILARQGTRREFTRLVLQTISLNFGRCQGVQLMPCPLLGPHAAPVPCLHPVGIQEQGGGHTAGIDVLVCCLPGEHVPDRHTQGPRSYV